MATEYELKFSASEETFRQLLLRYPGKTISMGTTYYDTKERSLSALHCTLRTRMENDVPVCTLKIPAPDDARLELECNCQSITDGLEKLLAMDIPTPVKDQLQKPLFPVCGAKFTRNACDILWEGALLELALDQGALLGKSRQIPLREVEVELKDGSREAARSFADYLQKTYHLTHEPLSKFARAKEVG